MSEQKKTYMILADSSDEFERALCYAALSAKRVDAGVLVLYVLGEPEFQHWGMIEHRMRHEQREQADLFLKQVSAKVLDLSGVPPQVIVAEGKKTEQIIKALENDPSIHKLILAASSNPAGPGPLIEYFVGKGRENLKVTLTIVPGHLSIDDVKKLL